MLLSLFHLLEHRACPGDSFQGFWNWFLTAWQWILVVASLTGPHRSLCPGTRIWVSNGVSMYRGISMQGQGQIMCPEAFATLEWGWGWSLFDKRSPQFEDLRTHQHLCLWSRFIHMDHGSGTWGAQREASLYPQYKHIWPFLLNACNTLHLNSFNNDTAALPRPAEL